MSFSTFFPTNALALFFVLALIAWFLSWLVRFRKDTGRVEAANASLGQLDACIEPLRAQQLWRDRLRIGGREAPGDPGQFFDEVVRTTLAARTQAALPPASIQTHFRAIFAAGCEESQLDSAELTAATLSELKTDSDALRTETLSMLLAGVLGTLITLARDSAGRVATSLPPAIWGVLLVLAGNFLFTRFQARIQRPCFANLRRKTLTLWVPKLYPTVAQRAAQWAVQTLGNAARVADASEVINESTISFVASIADAKRAGEMFSEGMKQFSHGIEASDQALIRAQSKLGAEVDKFAESLRHWTAFEDEIRRFYSSVEAHQQQLVDERKTLEYMLSGYRDFVREATGVLEQSATNMGTAAGLLPAAFETSAGRMTQSTAELQAAISSLMENLAFRIEASQKEALKELHERMETTFAPILGMENRLRALGEPFERAASHMTEIATNLWKLNESFSREVTRQLRDK